MKNGRPDPIFSFYSMRWSAHAVRYENPGTANKKPASGRVFWPENLDLSGLLLAADQAKADEAKAQQAEGARYGDFPGNVEGEKITLLFATCV